MLILLLHTTSQQTLPNFVPHSPYITFLRLRVKMVPVNNKSVSKVVRRIPLVVLPLSLLPLFVVSLFVLPLVVLPCLISKILA